MMASRSLLKGTDDQAAGKAEAGSLPAQPRPNPPAGAWEFTGAQPGRCGGELANARQICGQPLPSHGKPGQRKHSRRETALGGSLDFSTHWPGREKAGPALGLGQLVFRVSFLPHKNSLRSDD